MVLFPQIFELTGNMGGKEKEKHRLVYFYRQKRAHFKAVNTLRCLRVKQHGF